MPLRRKHNSLSSDHQVLLEQEQRACDNDLDNTITQLSDNEDEAIRVIPEVVLYQHDYNDESRVALSDVPVDHYNFTYFVFCLMGIATMTPWNFFITAEDYWMYKFRNTSCNDTTNVTSTLTPMQKSFTSDLTLTASISGTTFLILNAIYGHNFSPKLKIIGALSLILTIFIATIALVEINTDHWQEQFFLITLFTVVIINVSSAIMSGGIFGIAGIFPSHYMTALVSGQALGGVLTALSLILVLTFAAAPNVTAFIYFIIGSMIILITIASYVIMCRQPFFSYYIDRGDIYKICGETRSHTYTNINSADLKPNIRDIFRKIYVEAVCICLLFATTLSVYPAVSVLMQSENYGNGKAWNDIYYVPVVNYLFFNSGDYFGRVLAGIWQRPQNNSHTVLLLTLVRLFFIPYFLCANSNLHQFLTVILHSDVAFIIMMVQFAISNGYLANILLIIAPRSVMQHEKEVASSIMAASLSSGLALGSIVSMVFVQIL